MKSDAAKQHFDPRCGLPFFAIAAEQIVQLVNEPRTAFSSAQRLQHLPVSRRKHVMRPLRLDRRPLLVRPVSRSRNHVLNEQEGGEGGRLVPQSILCLADPPVTGITLLFEFFPPLVEIAALGAEPRLTLLHSLSGLIKHVLARTALANPQLPFRLQAV